jgi:pyruvate,water dikinase
MLIKFFPQITKRDVASAGGKGASLGEMTKAKIPVPPGFVVLADAFYRFLEETDLTQAVQAVLDKINYQDINAVDGASVQIRSLILKARMPKDLERDITADFKKLKTKFVAVRSSATAEDSAAASWAGELETYLNTTDQTLLLNVKKCWSSLFTPRAIFYRHEKKLLKTKVGVAVVVQQMVESEISGIAFTVHPVTQDRRQMIIEAGYGLGEAIVSGSITPDSYVLDKRDYSLLDINVAEQTRQITKGAAGGTKWVPVAKTLRSKQKLTGRQIVALAQICLGIEQHYKFPCDIEWAYVRGKFYITQSRPITTL